MKILALIPKGQENSPIRYYRGEGMLEKLGVQVEYLKAEMDWVEWMRAAKEYDWLYVLRLYAFGSGAGKASEDPRDENMVRPGRRFYIG